MAVSVAAQDSFAYPFGVVGVADVSAVGSIVPLCWILVRSFRHRRLMRLLTATDDAADGDAPITRLAGRKMWIDTLAVPGPVQDGVTPGLKMQALAGQDAERFSVGDRIHLSWRGNRRGRVLLVGSFGGALIGFAKRRGRRTDHASPASHAPV